MQEVAQLGPADARRVPWKNGRGTTLELAIWPAGATLEAEDFLWRISKARVEEDGPFSSFAGCERHLVILEGAGLALSIEGSEQAAFARPFEPVRFSGDASTAARLARGPVADFNVIARRGAWEAEVDALRLAARRAREPLGAGHAFVHVAAGSARVRVSGEDEGFELGPGDSLWIRDAVRDAELDLAGASQDARLILVRLWPSA